VWRVPSTQWKGRSKVRPSKTIRCKRGGCIYRVLVGEVSICTKRTGPMSVQLTASTRKVKTPESGMVRQR
jgi:hypothetical protein